MKKRRFLAALLATTMVLSSTVFATDATSNSSTGTNANDDHNGTTFNQGLNSYKDGYFELALPGELAFTIDPARQNSDLQVVGGDYNIINLGDADTEISVYPSIAYTSEEMKALDYKVVTSSPLLTTGKAYSNGQYVSVSSSAYKDITTKKGLFLTMLAADKPSGGMSTSAAVDINKDGVFEFDYSTNTASNMLGVRKYATRAAYSWEDPEGTYYIRDPKQPVGTVSQTALVIPKIYDTMIGEDEDKLQAEMADLVSGGAYMTFFLPKRQTSQELKDDDQNVLGYANSITSFTLAGAVNADSVYPAESIAFRAVYVINSATPEKQVGYGTNTDKGGKLRLVSHSALQ